MARLGQKAAEKNTENGKGYFGDKDIAFLEQSSRQVVEEHHNMPITFLEVDWDNSKKNIYGEIKIKKFKDSTGVQLRGTIQLQQEGQRQEKGFITSKMILTFSIFTEQLEELNIKPRRGDYFKIGKRYYYIYKKTIEDAGVGNVMLERKQMRLDYYAYEESNELIQKNVKLDNGDEFNTGSEGTIL